MYGDHGINERSGPRVSIVAAMSAERRAIGKGEKLLWHIPDDMKRFKRLTGEHPVIMGRKTFESILEYLKKPLPNRTNIVITRNPTYTYEGALIVSSVEEALDEARARESKEVFIGGGSEIYREALPHVDRLYLTLIEDEPDADTFFPDYSEFTRTVESEGPYTHGDLTYRWVTLER